MFLFFIPLHIAVLVVLMRLFAKEDAEVNLIKCALLFGITCALLHLATDAFGPLYAFVLYFVLPLLVLGGFLSIPWRRSAYIAAAFLVYLILFTIAITLPFQ